MLIPELKIHPADCVFYNMKLIYLKLEIAQFFNPE